MKQLKWKMTPSPFIILKDIMLDIAFSTYMF
jgi:hypothetical protein